jgi:hypothetical protein
MMGDVADQCRKRGVGFFLVCGLGVAATISFAFFTDSQEPAMYARTRRQGKLARSSIFCLDFLFSSPKINLEQQQSNMA